MRRTVLVIIAAIAVATIVGLWTNGAQARSAHGFSTTWCDSPILLPLASAEGGQVVAADGVATARGTEPVVTSRGPSIRMNERGSRVQVSFGQTLFHTQWLFGAVDSGDSLRVDARLADSDRPISAVSVRGGLVAAEEQGALGLTVIGREDADPVGQIDVFVGATEVLFTNESDGPIELIGAIGCPAIALTSETLQTPTWDAEAQRFIAEYEVSFANRLANARTRALRTQDPDTASSILDDLSVEVDLRAQGFSSATIEDLRLSTDLERRRNPAFDGVDQPVLLETPLRLSDSSEETIRLTVAYEPNFDDPSWAEGVEPPAPSVRLLGRVDDVTVGVVATLVGGGAELDSSVDTLATPTAGLTVEHVSLRESSSDDEGVVAISERITVRNIGESAVADLSVNYSLDELYGDGTWIVDMAGAAAGSCAGNVPDRFDGVGSSLLLFDAAGLDVGAECIIDIRARLIPGIIPAAEGTDFEGSVSAIARSGLREVTDATTVRASIGQISSAEVTMSPTSLTNLRDGRYRLSGDVTLSNTGDQTLREVVARLDVFNDADDADGAEGAPEPFSVNFESLAGDETCSALAPSQRARSGSLITNGGSLAPGQSCTISYSLVARPFAKLDGWIIAGFANATTPRGVELDVGPDETTFDLDEAPAIAVDIGVVSTTNNTDGTYTLEVDSTVSNDGDTPLVSAFASSDADVVFGDRLVALDRTVDTCAAIDWSNPLQSVNPVASCLVRERIVVAPGAELSGWTLTSSAAASSTSGAEVTHTDTSDEITFTENPAIRTSIEMVAVEKVDDGTFRYRMSGLLENVGDIELRDVSVEFPISAALEGTPITIERIGANGVTISDRFDGGVATGLLTGNDVMPSESSARWDMTFTARTGSLGGPFIFDLGVAATSPATETVEVHAEPIERAVPIIGILERKLTPTNNNDGTYSIEHFVRVLNVGGASIPAISVFTDLESEFRGLLVGEVEVQSTCGDGVAPGESCTAVRTATLRPGSAVGPYAVSVNVSATSVDGVDAGVVAEPISPLYESVANAPVFFEEAPAIEVRAERDAQVNLGDGTYSVAYRFIVENSGDVPLYRITANNPIVDSYGERLVGTNFVGDTCSAVSFGSPLGPEQACTIALDAVVRPLDELGPWAPEFSVIVDSPSFAKIAGQALADPVTFEERVTIDADSALSVLSNNGDGSYNIDYGIDVTNTSDVPWVQVAFEDQPSRFTSLRDVRSTTLDECSGVSFSRPLPPGDSCRLEFDDRVVPGAQLGPHRIATALVGVSPSGAEATVDVESNDITFTENPVLALSSQVVSVEAVEAGVFRVVANLDVENAGDVRIDDLSVLLDLEAAFPDSVFRIDGAISDDFEMNEAFEVGESTQLLAGAQSLQVGTAGTITLVVSVEPEGQPGPFVTELRASGVSPASAETTTVIDAAVDLPSIAVEIVTQSVDNNRDGSYTVTTSYAVENDGSTTLEFVRLTEDLAEVFAGTAARLVSIDSDDVATADLEDRRRGSDLTEWGTSLEAGQRVLVTTTAVVEPGNVLGPFQSEVGTSAQSPAGTPVSAQVLSDETIEFVEQPALRVEQTLLRRPEWNSTGRFDVTFGIDVINDGDVELRSVQVREDLLAALGTNSQIIVRDIRSDSLTVNENFDGLGRPPQDLEAPIVDENGELVEEPARETRDVGDTRVLQGWDTLPAGETATIEVDLTIIPENRGVYSTRVVVSARTPAGAGIGSEGDVIEANTLTRLSVQGEIGLAKRTLGEPDVRPDGSIGVTYEILVENVGPFPLTNVAVHDQLSQAFGVGSTFVTSRVRIEAESPCSGFESSSYDGGTIDPVLVSRVELQPGESCRLQYDAAVIPSKPLPGPYRSSAFAIASDPFSGTVIDDSTDGTNTDPDGNQEPGDNDIATAVQVIPPDPELRMTVTPLESIPIDRDGWHEFGYLVTLENAGKLDIDSTRLLASLDDDWSFSYEVVGSSSDTLTVNDGFDGGRDTNVLARRNRLRAGDSAEVELILRSAVPQPGEVSLALVFQGTSVTNVEIEVESPTVTTAAVEREPISISGWFSSLTVEEQRLLGLGAAAFLLFLIMFSVRAIRRFRVVLNGYKAQREHREAVIDLRTSQTIDLRDRAHTVDSSTSSDVDDHHRPRRRRGRRNVGEKR